MGSSAPQLSTSSLKSLVLVPGPGRGPWSLVPGPGPWSLVPGPRSLVLVPGPWSLVPGPLVLVPGAGPWRSIQGLRSTRMAPSRQVNMDAAPGSL